MDRLSESSGYNGGRFTFAPYGRVYVRPRSFIERESKRGLSIPELRTKFLFQKNFSSWTKGTEPPIWGISHKTVVSRGSG